MKTITSLLSLLLLTGCTSGNAQEQHGTIKAPWDEWYFTFSTPKALPAQVTLVKLLDTDGYGYVFQTIDQPQGDSVGKWDTHNGLGSSPFNKAKSPPQMIKFCWDSIIDKKVYETTLYFSLDTQHKMVSSEPDWSNPKETYYFRYMVIGLAPEGKVRVWLKNNGDPDVLQTSTQITTVSGKELAMCKNETNFPDGYEYSEGMKTFIKDKKYPYGSW
ncbi:DUF2931 family protein (plasmid) [Rahnella aquatilis]|jgi:hypothetical protein|uniref:DUF2931 family protein n=1 Tax=Rahnella sp. (strain Y9602) TaxID=2703885 RepID=UPI0010409757|nr:DUF2931 family protein [Rahnella aceris]MBU9865096.1 DUF2931 family protein [Rahnella aceris]QBJ07024.1 DUF2931 family protein [Rahnella aquatilis]CAH0217788.1 hypothetical protein SRABI106_01895 [Rahnella aquatilis]